MSRIVHFDPSKLFRELRPSPEQRALLRRLVEDLQIVAIDRPLALQAIARYAHDLARPIRIKYSTERMRGKHS